MLNKPNLVLILRPQAASFFKPDTLLSFTADITAAEVRKAVLLNMGEKKLCWNNSYVRALGKPLERNNTVRVSINFSPYLGKNVLHDILVR